MIRAIVHADKKWGIGKNNDMMFSLPKDMKFFRETTSGHTVVMGGKTLRAMPNGKPLKNRVNIVLTRGQVTENCVTVRSFDELKAELKARKDKEIYIIGGGEIYKALLPYCHEALVTKVDAVGGAEVFFPNLDELKEWKCAYSSESLESNDYKIKFTTYENLSVKE